MDPNDGTEGTFAKTILNYETTPSRREPVFCKAGWYKTGVSEQGYGSHVVHA